MNHLTARWGALTKTGAVKHGQSPLDGYKWRAERLSLIEGSGYHPGGDLDAARAKQEARWQQWKSDKPKGTRRPDRYKPANVDQWVETGYTYFTSANTEPGTVAFLDYSTQGRTHVEIHYLAVRPDQRRTGKARELIEALYERYPEAKIHWGKLMQPEMGRLHESFQESHPEQTGTGSRYY